jgi:nucleoside-diphosphate-sugar epimerase
MATGRTVFLTGATGFIGSPLAERLVVRGDRLRCLVRNAERAAHLSRLGAELIVGDVTDQTAIEKGMRGCALAYHLGAIYDVGVVDGAQLEHTNVGGTAAFIAALERGAAPRGVYVSTTVALGPTSREPSDRLVEYDGPYPSAYHRTKAQAHRLAREAQSRGVPLIIVCPAFVYGPGDQGPGGRFIKDLLKGSVPALVSDPAWFSYVYVDDVVDGLLMIGDRAKAGSTYVLSGEPESMNGFAERVARLGGVRAPRLRFPSPLAKLTGAALDVVARMTGLRFAITREGVATTANSNWLHSHEPATREFDWRPRSLEEGLPPTVRSLSEQQPT